MNQEFIEITSTTGLDKSLENIKQLGNLSFEKKENKEVYNKFINELNEILNKYF